MDAYVQWFAPSDGAPRRRRSQRALAVLRLLGLFDRPATPTASRPCGKRPPSPGLTEPLVGMSEAQRNIALTRLEAAKLLTVNRDAAGTLRLARCASAAARILRPAAAHAAARRLARGAPAALRTPLRDARRTSPSPRSKTSSRSTKPWPTAARRGCSRRRVTRSTATASSAGRGSLQHEETRRVRFRLGSRRLLLRDAVEPRLARAHGSRTKPGC